MELLEIITFGGLSVRLGGNPVIGFHSRKTEALLVYLAAHRTQQPRAKLAEMLWEQRSRSQALSNLRVAISNLRKLLSPYLVINREFIGLNSNSAWWYDATQFEIMVANEQIEAALELYQGDFLDSFYVNKARTFERWQAQQFSFYRQKVQATFHIHVKQLTSQGLYEEAIQQVRRLIAINPLDETAQLSLMHLLALTHQRSEVLHQYHTYSKLLNDELAVKPSAEMTAMFQQIQSNELPESSLMEVQLPVLPAYLDARKEPSVVPTEVFVGRERALAQLDDHLSHSLQWHGGVVFVSGETGSGKTALVHEFARRSQVTYPNLIAVMGSCHLYTGTGNPFGPFREVLDMLTGDIESHWATRRISREHAMRLWDCLPLTIEKLAECAPALVGTLLPLNTLINRIKAAGMQDELGPYLSTFTYDFSGSDQNHTFQQYVDFMIAVSSHYPMLIILDDLQWADPSTIGLLSYLGGHLRESRILTIGTCRSEDITRNLDESQPSLEVVSREFKRQFGDIWIDLDHQLEHEKEAFVNALLDTRSLRFSSDFSQQLARHTGGHPLFVVELLNDLQLQEHLGHYSKGHWTEPPDLDWDSLPARIEAVVEIRLARLDGQAYQVLKAASVVGETFTVAVITHTLGWDELLVQQIVNSLMNDHILLTETGIYRLHDQWLSEYRFRHPLIQGYVYKSLGQVERVHLHEKVGLALEALYYHVLEKPNDLVPQLAHHFYEARSSLTACDYLLETGNRAVQMGAHAEAIQQFRKGLDLLQLLPVTPERNQKEISLSLAMFSPLQALRGYADPELIRLNSRVSELCEEASGEAPLLSTLHILRGAHKSIEERNLALQQAKKIVRNSSKNDQLLVALSHWTLGVEKTYQGKFSAAKNHLIQVNELYQTKAYPWCVFLFGNDPGISSKARLAWILWFLGYSDQADRESRDALAMAKNQNHSVVLGFAIGIGGVLFNQLRRDAEAVMAWNLESIQHSKKDRLSLFRPGETISRGWALTQIGQITEGLQMMENGLDAWRQSSATRHFPQYLGMLAEGYLLAGQMEKGLQSLEEGLEVIESSRERYYEAELHRLKGEILTKGFERRVAEAEACYEQAITVAQQQKAKSWELRATISLCQLLNELGRGIEAYKRLSEIYNWFIEGFETPDLLLARGLLNTFKGSLSAVANS
jgi:DNA-binding SARP family transcriptional activator/predicted ATPase